MNKILNFLQYWFNTTLDFTRIIWSVSANLIYQMLILMVGAMALIVPDQSWDLFQSFAEVDITWYKVIFFIGVLCWGFSLWLCSRIVLYLVNLSAVLAYYRRYLSESNTDINADNNINIEVLLTESLAWIPRFFGAAPFFIVALAYQVALSKNNLGILKVNDKVNLMLQILIGAWFVLLILSVSLGEQSGFKLFLDKISKTGNLWLSKIFHQEKEFSTRNIIFIKIPTLILLLLTAILFLLKDQITTYYTIFYLAFGFLSLSLFPLYSAYFNAKDQNFVEKRFELRSSLSFMTDIWPRKSYSIPLIVGSVLSIVIGILLVCSAHISEYLMPGTIIVFSLCFWTYIGGMLNALSIGKRFPIGFILIIVVIVVSFFNNNHALNTTHSMPNDTRNTVENHFETWKKQQTQSGHKKVILVAAEGGGIRAAYWSANVLAALEKEIGPDFYHSIFAMSGASGGSVGVTMYTAAHEANTQNTDYQSTVNNICASDFLSSLTSGFVYADVVQRLLPYPFKSNCRARFLEAAFSTHFDAQTNNSGQLNKGLSNLSSTAPLLLLNAAHVESGKKAILCNDKLDTEHYFLKTTDVLHDLQADVPLKAAASASARFPIVTPPALLLNPVTNTRNGHLIDGGNIDNTGLHSLWQLLRELRASEDTATVKSDFLVLYLSNGSNLESNPTTLGATYEMAPIFGFVSAWATQSISKPFDSQLLTSDLNAKMLRIDLDYNPNRAVLPLGWFLSENAHKELQYQINQLDTGLNKNAIYELKAFMKE